MPFEPASIAVPFRMQPGLVRLGPDAVSPVTPAHAGSRHVREKTAVLAAFPERALAAVDGFDAHGALAAVAAASDGAFAVHGETDAEAPGIGWALVGGSPVGPGEPTVGEALARLPVRQRIAALACLAVEEDLAVLDGATGTVPWLAVALPSRWAPEEKAGLPLLSIHAPVADADRVRAATDGLVALATSGDRFERFVWSVSPDPRLHQHPAHGFVAWDADADADGLAALAWLRHERQAFLPVPAAGSGGRQAVFTIRVASEPLAAAVRTPADAARLHDAIASMTPAVLAYKGLAPARSRLLAWLARRAAGAA